MCTFKLALANQLQSDWTFKRFQGVFWDRADPKQGVDHIFSEIFLIGPDQPD